VRGLGFGLIALGIGLAANSLLGPLVGEAVDFHVTETLRNQMIGLDAVSLFVVAPLSVAAGLLVLRGHVVPGVAFALLAAVLYRPLFAGSAQPSSSRPVESA
jgi:hypothetical protein